MFLQVCLTLDSKETMAVGVTVMLPLAAMLAVAAGKPPCNHFPFPTNIAITAVIIPTPHNLSAPRTARGRAIVVMSATTLKNPP